MPWCAEELPRFTRGRLSGLRSCVGPTRRSSGGTKEALKNRRYAGARASRRWRSDVGARCRHGFDRSYDARREHDGRTDRERRKRWCSGAVMPKASRLLLLRRIKGSKGIGAVSIERDRKGGVVREAQGAELGFRGIEIVDIFFDQSAFAGAIISWRRQAVRGKLMEASISSVAATRQRAGRAAGALRRRSLTRRSVGSSANRSSSSRRCS